MDPLKKILDKKVEDRTKADLKYLELHQSELSTDQLQQLMDEDEAETSTSTAVKLEDASKEEVVTNIESKDLGDGEIEVVIASNSLDRHGEKISIDGLDIKAYKKNNVVLWAHDYDQPPIGRATRVWKDAGKLMGKVKFAIEESPFAKTIYDLVKGGFINAASIGFIPLEMDGNTYTKSEMVEFSIVPVPANSDALISARKLGIDTTIIGNYTNYRMYKLEDILKKDIADLKIGEIKFLREHLDDLTKSQVTKYASVLKEEKDDEEDEAAKAKAQADAEAKKAEDQKVLDDKLKALTDEIEAIKKADPVIIKNINLNKGVKPTGDEVSKEMKFLYFVQGLQTKNWDKYLEIVGKDAMNTTDDANILVPQEFVTEVTRLEEDYGVARRFATLRRSTSGAGVRFLLGADDVEIFDTAESGVKKSTKLSYNFQTLLWRKFAAILPITDELTEDAAIDLWNDATQRFARAYAKREDQLVFTEVAAGGNTKAGITTVAGTNLVEVANLTTAVTYDAFVDMLLGVPSASGNNGTFFLNRTMLGLAMKLKDDTGRPLWIPAVSGGVPPYS